MSARYAVQIWSKRWVGWAEYPSLWVAQAVQRDFEYKRGLPARVVPLPDYAAKLRELVLWCPNRCPGALEESLHVDGLHLRCTQCGFFTTEAYARHYKEDADV